MRRALLLLLCTLAPMLASCALNPPRIVSISPNREVTDVPTNQAISITFDRPMNQASVEQRFSLSPALSGCTESAGCRFQWTGNTFTYLHPKVNFALTTQYTVSMHAGYADASGQQNSLEHVWHFTTEAAPLLTSVDPADGASAVLPDGNIDLSFSRPMQLASVQASLQLTPDVPFLLRPRPGGDGSQFAVVPLSVLQPNQTYALTVDRPLDVHGNPLTGRIQTRFKTGSLTLAHKIAYLMGGRDAPPVAVGIVDPHADTFLQRSTPKILYSLSAQTALTDTLLGFDWSPDGQRLAVIEAGRTAGSGPIQIVDLATGTVIRPGISGSAVYWSPDGSIVYLAQGVVHRFLLSTLQDETLTDPADGQVIAPVAVGPDGRSIAYSTADAQGVDHLWILNVDLRIRYKPVGLDNPADDPAWSPSGTKLAFRRVTNNGPQLAVYDLNASGSASYRGLGPLDISGCAWLNDNSTLIAATGYGNGASLYRVNIFSATEAGGTVKVTGVSGAPNGSSPTTPFYDRRVAFTGVVDGLPQLFVMNGDGSRPQQLTAWAADFPYTASAPNWSPLG